MAFFNKWATALILELLLGYGSVYAMKCGAKKVHIQAPWSSFYFYAAAEFTQISANKLQNEWYVLNMSDYGTAATEDFLFFQSNDSWNEAKIAKDGFNSKTATSAAFFSCTDFGSNDALYIFEDPNNRGKTIWSTEPPDAQYFYFLPPNEPEWFQGTAQILVDNKRIDMEMDPNRCGWFRKVFFSEAPPENILLGLDVAVGELDFEIGENGLDDAIPVPINLSAKFATLGKTVYFNAEEGNLGWTTIDPGEVRQCTYNLAAYIYDTDAQLHPAFSCQELGPGEPACNIVNSCIGVVKGIVMPELGSDRKPVYNPASGCFTSAELFSQMFNPTPTVNHPYCYDVPFARAEDGLWEFDSDNNPAGGKGFYPLEPTSSVEDLVVTNPQIAAIYAGQPSVKSKAATQRKAEGSVPPLEMLLRLNPATGVPYIDTYIEDNGYIKGMFGNGDQPDVWDWEKRDLLDGQEFSKRNEHFCFESHAKFVYRPGQRFYFRGDDDIWVFINNKIAVDLGGTHLAAPGAVFLDTMNLTPGTEYPIDIFFCDRRTTMSNVRIKTNIYFEQTKSIFFVKDGNVTQVYGLQKGGGSCSALDQKNDTLKGKDMKLDYWLLNNRGDTLDPTDTQSSLMPGQTYYGGITIGEGWFEIDEDKLTRLAPGRYRLVVYDNETKEKAQRVFRIAGTVGFRSVAGNIGESFLELNPAAEALAGTLISFEVANKADNVIDTEAEAYFQLKIPPGLSVYYDSNKTEQVLEKTTIATINGIRRLWAAGSTTAPTDSTYSLMILGNRDTLHLHFYLPSLAFVDSISYLKDVIKNTDLLGESKPPLGEGFSGVYYPTWLVAFDGRTGEICYTCNDLITVTTDNLLTFINGSGAADLRMLEGRLNLMVKGQNLVEKGMFTAVAESPAVTTFWYPIDLEPPPVPFIDSAAMFDADGDGAGDSLVIWFDRSISVADSTPDSLIITWPTDSKNNIVIRGREAILAHVVDKGAGNIFSLTQKFTTQPLTGAMGDVQANFTFVKNGRTYHLNVKGAIADRMPPLLASANVKINKEKNTSAMVFDTLIINFTEAVAKLDLKEANPFEFLLVSESAKTPVTINPFVAFWAPDMRSVELRYRPVEVYPRMGDSVRIMVQKGTQILADKRGNLSRKNNPYVVIKGAKRSELSEITLAKIDPYTMVERWNNKAISFIAPVGMYEEFANAKANIRQEYGDVLGHLIKIDMKAILSDSSVVSRVREAKGLNYQLTRDDIKLVVKTQYYTNIGAFLANSEHTIGCNDKIYGGDCTGSGNANVFVGWNLRSEQQRIVGSGAYIACIQTYVVLDGIGKLNNTNLEKCSIWGVVRSRTAH